MSDDKIEEWKGLRVGDRVIVTRYGGSEVPEDERVEQSVEYFTQWTSERSGMLRTAAQLSGAEHNFINQPGKGDELINLSAQERATQSGSDPVALVSLLPPFMSTDSATRKLAPVASGVLAYFPDALMCVAWISRVGNDKHNPGEPLHWAKEKSTDEPDCVIRHMLDYYRKLPPDPGLEALGELGHLASAAWRALANLQRACDAERVKREGGGK